MAAIGGQAVLEGVMMRGVRNWAVAVRTPAPDQLDEEGARKDVADPPTGASRLATSAPSGMRSGSPPLLEGLS